MTMRSCAYKKCENYVNLRDRSSNDVKLFSFPKNPERRKKWIELGKVSQNLSESMYFFCSDHFDKKFQAINNRRTVLVGEALPFPYVDPEIDESYRDEEADINFLMYDLNGSSSDPKEEYANDQDIVVESTTITSDIQDNLDEQQFNTLQKDEHEEYIICSDDGSDKEEPISYNINKRKNENTFSQATSSKSKVIKTSQVQKPSQNTSQEVNANIKLISHVAQSKINFSSKDTFEDYTNLIDLVDAKHVTTFIFKGEEYVQMPKDYYIKEKTELMKKIKKMEHALEAIKKHLTTLDM